MLFPSNSYALSEKTYKMLADYIYANSGLRYDASSRPILQRRLSKRIRELNLDSFENYYYYLMYHPGRESEMELLFDLITTNETYFFREERQLRAFTDELIPRLASDGERPRSLRIWSAGCSTGEEPYTLAILCRNAELLHGWNIDLFASDLSQKVIQAARSGIYRESAFRSTPPEVREQYFEKIAENQYQISEDIRRMVTFGKLNFLDERKTGILGEFDLIFCRNVIIYFDLEAKKRAIEVLYRCLKKDAYLLLGHAESLLSLSTRFRLVHLTNDMVYQK